MTNEEVIEILKTAEFSEDYTVEEVRQALDMAIRALKNEQTDGDLISKIDKLPRIKVGNSNSPTVKYCIDEVLLYDLLENMPSVKTDGDLISLQALSKKLNKYKPVIYTENTEEMEIQNIFDILTQHTAMLNDIKMMLPVEKTAEWLQNPDDMAGSGYFICSNCKNDVYDTSDYCPNCGCRMGVEQ